MDQERVFALKKIPPIGMRMVKSMAAVFLCFLIGMLRGGGDVYQSVISTLFCIQEQMSDSKQAAFNRIIGTLVGGAFGALAVLMQVYVFPAGTYDGVLGYLFITVMIIPVIYTTMLLKLRSIAYFSCVVFLTMAMGIVNEEPVFFIFSRLVDTFIGVFVAIAINSFKLPRKYHNDILFVTGLDDALLNVRQSFSPYSKIELNKMIEEGAKFSVFTYRTPASLAEVASEINLNLPVITMDGAALYDMEENEYLKVYVISAETVQKLLMFIKGYGLNCYTNTIMGDIMVTYCQEGMTEIEEIFYLKYKKSPYRHYVKGKMPEGQDAVYLMLVSDKETIKRVADDLRKQDFAVNLKIKEQEAIEFEGYYYLRIYNKNASRRNMIGYMKKYVHAKEVVTFGSADEKCDIVICENDTNETVKKMKKIYKPLWFKK